MSELTRSSPAAAQQQQQQQQLHQSSLIPTGSVMANSYRYTADPPPTAETKEAESWPKHEAAPAAAESVAQEKMSSPVTAKSVEGLRAERSVTLQSVGPALEAPKGGGFKGFLLRTRAALEKRAYQSDPNHWDCPLQCRCANGPPAAFWPPMYAEEKLKKSRWLRCKRFTNFYVR